MIGRATTRSEDQGHNCTVYDMHCGNTDKKEPTTED